MVRRLLSEPTHRKWRLLVLQILRTQREMRATIAMTMTTTTAAMPTTWKPPDSDDDDDDGGDADNVDSTDGSGDNI